MESSSENGGKTLEATADLRRGTLWKTVLQLKAMRRICDKESKQMENKERIIIIYHNN